MNGQKIVFLLTILFAFGCVGKETEFAKPKKIPAMHGPHRPILPRKRTMVCGTDTKPTVIAVVDTGFSYSQFTKDVKLCKFGHKDFSPVQATFLPPGLVDPVPVDNHGHGTNVVGIIQDFAKNKNYCIVVLKYYDPTGGPSDNLKSTIEAFKYAVNIGVDYINYSGGGVEFSKQEKEVVEKFLDKGGRFIAAAGNERADVEKHPYYPAMYDSRIISVGSMEKDGFVAHYSNYGESISYWEYGTDIVGFGTKMSGTSQATAVVTGKMINQSECDK